jgi:hypothetical protein
MMLGWLFCDVELGGCEDVCDCDGDEEEERKAVEKGWLASWKKNGLAGLGIGCRPTRM